MPIPCFQVDAFSDGPFTGNPAAVCLLESPAPEAWMQNVATEMNLSETAFLSPSEDDSNHWNLRWFTPAAEVDLCGHATLASAFVMFATGTVERGRPIRFSTASGVLVASKVGQGEPKKIELDFPECPVRESPAPIALGPALGTEINKVYTNGTDLLIELPSEQHVRALSPDFVKLAAVEEVRGVIVTSRSEQEEFDFVSRFFGPAVGINEDPVTGSAHCSLGPYWFPTFSRQKMTGYQASTRGGVVEVELHDADDGARRVKLRGSATLVIQGQLVVEP